MDSQTGDAEMVKIIVSRQGAPHWVLIDKWQLIWSRWKWRAPAYVEVKVELDP